MHELLLVTFARLLRPRNGRAFAAESLLRRQQRRIRQPHQQAAPNQTSIDRSMLGVTSPSIGPSRITKPGAFIRPAAYPPLLLADLSVMLDASSATLWSKIHGTGDRDIAIDRTTSVREP